MPIWVHDNYIEGNSSLPIGPGLAYSGAALITDGDASPSSKPTAYVLFTTNEVVATAGAGIDIAYGHDVTAKENRIVSCGMKKNYDWYAWGASAIEIANYYGAPNFYNNTISGTVGGMLGIGATPHAATVHDIWVNPPDMLDSSNSVADNSFSDPCLSGKKVDLNAEDEERSYWAAKIVAAGQLIGDQHLPVS